ncbi:MAG: hypothetical protein E3J87_07165 [Candidatus Cloacimonadota bacterium]|nr:MAG: hypothetical protein E3J87_07165 [Candidatus Cloacimonadota bacterium]
MNLLVDTGDNLARGVQALKLAKQKLVKEKGCIIKRDVIDSSGRIFGFEAISRDGIHFYCVARSTPPMKQGIYEIVSTQTRFVKRAKRELKPLVIFWPNDFYVFSPQIILSNNHGENVRADKGQSIRFLNFESKLGVKWFVPGLEAAMTILKLKKRGDLSTYTGEPE